MARRKTDPLAERERLQAEQREIAEVRRELVAKARDSKAELDRLAKVKREALAAAARQLDGAEDALAEVKAATLTAQAEQREIAERTTGAEDAHRQAEQALRVLYVEHLPAFMDEAEQATRKAVEEREAFVAAAEKLRSAHGSAARSWNVLRKATQAVHNQRLGTVPSLPESIDQAIRDVRKARAPEPQFVAASRRAQVTDSRVPAVVRGLFRSKRSGEQAQAEPGPFLEVAGK